MQGQAVEKRVQLLPRQRAHRFKAHEALGVAGFAGRWQRVQKQRAEGRRVAVYHLRMALQILYGQTNVQSLQSGV